MSVWPSARERGSACAQREDAQEENAGGCRSAVAAGAAGVLTSEAATPRMEPTSIVTSSRRATSVASEPAAAVTVAMRCDPRARWVPDECIPEALNMRRDGPARPCRSTYGRRRAETSFPPPSGKGSGGGRPHYRGLRIRIRISHWKRDAHYGRRGSPAMARPRASPAHTHSKPPIRWTRICPANARYRPFRRRSQVSRPNAL